VANGRTSFPHTIAEKLAPRRDRTALTERELEALRHIVRGRSNKEIASELPPVVHRAAQQPIGCVVADELLRETHAFVGLSAWWGTKLG
jgi:hypothetical protein